jgi:hypothetical protein
MKIIKAGTYGMFDLFQGEGWKNHSRFQIKKTPIGKKLIFISGNLLPKWQVHQLLSLVEKGN